LAVAGALLLAGVDAFAQKQKVYRWVDADGNIHYTESLPPDYRDTGHDVLNEQGMVVDENQRLTPQASAESKSEDEVKAEEAAELPRDSSGLPRPKPLYTEAEKQQRMDNFLMLRYESEQEITDAMNVEIKQLNYDRRLIEGSQASIEESWRGQVREAANRQRAGQAVDTGMCSARSPSCGARWDRTARNSKRSRRASRKSAPTSRPSWSVTASWSRSTPRKTPAERCLLAAPVAPPFTR